jgi:hypothetical protein
MSALLFIALTAATMFAFWVWLEWMVNNERDEP